MKDEILSHLHDVRNKLLLAAAAVALGAFFAPRPAEASIPRDIAHLQRTPPPAVPAPVVDFRPVEFRRVVVEVDGILFELICRNDPVNLTDPTGLDSLMLTGEGKAYWAIEKDWYGPNPTVRTVEIGTWGNGVVNLAAQFGGGALRIPELQAAAIQTYVLNESGRSVMSKVSEDLQNGYISAVLKRVQAGSYATKSAGREIAASTLDTVVLGPLTAIGNAVSPGQPYLSPSEIRKFWGVLSDGVNEKSPTFRNTRCTITFGMSAWGAYRGLNASAAESTGVKYIGKMDDLKSIPRSQTLLDDLPDLGSAKANYYQNSSVLRKALRDGYEIRDASAYRSNWSSDPTLLRPDRTVGQSCLGAERLILDNKALILDSSGAYVPR